jgi:hypothetical protein
MATLQEKVASIESALHSAYAQLPAAHGFDLAAGAALGGGAGAAYHALQKDKKKSLLGHVATGAVVGAGAADVVGDRTRRYITNVPAIGSYDLRSVVDTAKSHGWGGVWRGAVLDKPIAHTAPPADADTWQMPDKDKPDGWGATAAMRRELMRRSFGVHTEGPKDFFRGVGSTITPDGKNLPRIELNSRLIDQNTGKLLPDPNYGDISRDLFGDDLRGYTKYPGQNMSPVLAHYNLDRPSADVARVRDYWDYSLEPKQVPQLHQLLKDLFTHPSKLKEALPFSDNDLRNAGVPATRGDQLKSYLARVAVNDLLLKQPALLDQTVKFDPNTGRAIKAFSDIARDQGYTKDDAAIAKTLAPFAAG